MPTGITTTAWPSIVAKCTELGIGFDPWQHGAGRLILAKRDSGKYAAGIGGVVLSIPRQVGKTYMVGGIVFALCLLYPRLTVIWTAHRMRTSKETFMAMLAMSRRKKVAPHMLDPVRGSGEEEIRFRNESRILFGARERGFGVGFAEVDVLVVDEAQRATSAALDDMVPTTNQSKQPAGPLLFFMGTPPRPTDSGDVFRQKRDDALSGEDQDTAYIEFSADPDADPDDWLQLAKANPSYPMRTPREAILRMRKNLTDASFLREGLGIWDVSTKGLAVSPESWRNLTGETPPQGRTVSFALDVAPDHSTATLAASWSTAGGAWLQLADSRSGVDWVADRWRELHAQWGGRLIVEQTGTAAFLLPFLQHAEPVSRRFYADACSTLDAAVTSGSLRHGNQPELNAAVEVARWSTSGDAGQRLLSRRNAEVSPLVAAAMALHGVTALTSRPGLFITF